MENFGQEDGVHVALNQAETKMELIALRCNLAISTPVFHGVGLDDLSVGTGFTGSNKTKFSVSLVASNGTAVLYSGGFSVGDVVTQTDGPGAGTYGTVFAINPGDILILGNVVPSGAGFDGEGFTLSNGTVDATEGTVILNGKDLISWISSTGDSAYNIFIEDGAMELSDSATITFESASGHMPGSSWTWGYEFDTVKMGEFDGKNMTASLGDLQSEFGTKMVIDMKNNLFKLTNVPTFADEAAAVLAGLTTGQVYKVEGVGMTTLSIVS